MAEDTGYLNYQLINICSGTPAEDVEHNEVLLTNQTEEILSSLASQGIISEQQFNKFHMVALR